MSENATITDKEILERYVIPVLKSKGWQDEDIKVDYVFTEGRIIDNGTESRRMVGKRVDCMLFVAENYPVAVIEVSNHQSDSSTRLNWAKECATANDIRCVYSCSETSLMVHYVKRRYKLFTKLECFPSKQDLLKEISWNGSIISYNHYGYHADSIQFIPYYRGNNIPEPRYFQRVAVNRTYEAIISGKRRVLLSMPFQTGKSYTLFQIMYRLISSGTVKRVLYLDDSDVMAEQFRQRFANIFCDNDFTISSFNRWFKSKIHNGKCQPYENYETYRFELIVINIRGGLKNILNTGLYKMLRYFDEARQVCMTDTLSSVNLNNYASYFGEPLYTYKYDQGVEDGFIAPGKQNNDIDFSLESSDIEENLITEEHTSSVMEDVNELQQQCANSSLPKEKPEWYDSAVRKVVDGMMSKYEEEGVLDLETLDILQRNPFHAAGLHSHTAAFSNATEYDQKVRELKKKFCQ